MLKKQRNLKLKVLFNASVVLSGLKSSNGGSGKLLRLINKNIIDGEISEIVYDEILKHHQKLGIPKIKVEKECIKLFKKLINAPSGKMVSKYKKKVIDEGDAHVLASCEEQKIKYLVTLDQKHLLILKGKIKGLNILTPGELIELISRK